MYDESSARYNLYDVVYDHCSGQIEWLAILHQLRTPFQYEKLVKSQNAEHVKGIRHQEEISSPLICKSEFVLKIFEFFFSGELKSFSQNFRNSYR